VSAGLKCGKRGCDGHLEADTDRIGRIVYQCAGCARKRRGLCQDCPSRVTGKAWRCARCIEARRREQSSMFELRNREARLKAERERCAALPPASKAERNARKKAWREANPVRVMLHKRAGRKRGTWGYRTREKYLAAMRAQNARPGRAEKRRLAAKAQNVYLTQSPTCRACGGAVAWSGVGRPRLRCEACRGAEVRHAA
jgi:hypothetical protein